MLLKLVRKSCVLNESFTNVRSLVKNFYQLGVLVDKWKPLVVAVTENWLVTDLSVTPELSGYKYV